MLRYAAKLPGEGADMYDAAEALRDAMLALGLACDGGKDSVSMVARAGDEVRTGCQLATSLLISILLCPLWS